LEDNRWSIENFKFEASRMVNDDCSDTGTKACGDNSQGRDNLDIVLNKLEQCKRVLVKWSRRRKARAMSVLVRKQTKQIEKLQESIEPDIVSERKGYQAAIDDRLERDKLQWKQRAKVHWLQLGDRNTKFFHMYANQRKKLNHVSEVEDANGVICTNPVNISRAFMEYYQSFFSSSGSSNMDVCLEGLEERITRDMNDKFSKDFTMEEVCMAITQMSPLKSQQARMDLPHVFIKNIGQ
jgi:hypothetical protein